MTALDRNVVSEAVLLFEGRAISMTEADELCAKHGSREDFLAELWFRRGSLGRSPDLAELVERARKSALERAEKFDLLTGEKAERAFYEGVFARLDPSKPTAIYAPRWRDMANATRCLFEQTVPVPATAIRHPDDSDVTKVARYADILLASGIRHFVVSGGDNFHLALIRSILQEDSGIRFDIVWHGNYVQTGEEQVWRLFQQWLRAQAEGLITRIGVTKSGFDGFL